MGAMKKYYNLRHVRRSFADRALFDGVAFTGVAVWRR